MCTVNELQYYTVMYMYMYMYLTFVPLLYSMILKYWHFYFPSPTGMCAPLHQIWEEAHT